MTYFFHNGTILSTISNEFKIKKLTLIAKNSPEYHTIVISFIVLQLIVL